LAVGRNPQEQLCPPYRRFDAAQDPQWRPSASASGTASGAQAGEKDMARRLFPLTGRSTVSCLSLAFVSACVLSSQASTQLAVQAPKIEATIPLSLACSLSQHSQTQSSTPISAGDFLRPKGNLGYVGTTTMVQRGIPYDCALHYVRGQAQAMLHFATIKLGSLHPSIALRTCSERSAAE
jgi:hypothetical protein